TSYSLKAGADAALFSIDAGTGAVTLTGNPDYETKGSYSFTVVATDAAGNASEQAVTLSVVPDIPVITGIVLAGETLGVGDTATITIFIDDDHGIPLNAIDGTLAGYDLTNLTRIDNQTYSAQFTVVEGGQSVAVSGSIPLSFSLEDGLGRDTALYNTPVSGLQAITDFSTTDYRLYVDSDASAADLLSLGFNIQHSYDSDLVISLIAPDDSSIMLVYQRGASGNNFIDTVIAPGGSALADGSAPFTGTFTPEQAFSNLTGGARGVWTLRIADEAQADVGYLQGWNIQFTDYSGSMGPTSIDAALPVITSADMATAIDENSNVGQTVYIAAATDANNITYSLKAVDDHAAFSINSSTGAVTLSTNPDYETKASYSFTVVATDAAGNASEQVVTLGVNNLDDTAPTITSAATATAISENSGAGQVVYTVTSTDTDDVVTGSTSYSIKPGADAALFSIDATTGAVTLTGNPDYENKASYSFTVVATDAAGNASEQTVTLAINDLVDETAPTVSSIAISGASGAQNSTLNAGDVVSVTVTMDEATVVDTTGGTPRVALNVGGSTVYADYVSGSGTASLLFQYTILAGQTDANGISLDADALQANGGTLRDAAGNAANLAHGVVADNAGYLVDTTAPAVSSVGITGASGVQSNTLNAGDVVSVTVTMNEATVVDTSGGTPRVALNIGGSTVYANYVSGSGTASLLFQYTILAGQTDANGISIVANGLEAYGGTLSDAAGNDANLSHSLVADNASYLVDTTAPTLVSSTPADNASAVMSGANIVLTFNENLSAGSGNIVISNGTDTRTINVLDVSQVTISGNTVTINPTADLAAGSSYNLQMGSGVLTDLAGNPHAGISDATTLNFDTAPGDLRVKVVFDLVNGNNSTHNGGRVFDSALSYDIYIRVDSNSVNLNTGGDWAIWTGGANLGADDRIILVGDGAPVLGRRGGEITRVQGFTTAISWISSANYFAGIASNMAGPLSQAAGAGGFARFAQDTKVNVKLVDSWAGAFLGGQGFNVGTMYGPGTTQGLV
uniref:cadherin domain-containing protein n=1 Tax=Aeromonas caviae TaxID=648 RepID=UPI002B487BBB